MSAEAKKILAGFRTDFRHPTPPSGGNSRPS